MLNRVRWVPRTTIMPGSNGPMLRVTVLPECLEELLLVKGVTRELLFGADANYNHQIDPEELAEPSSRARGASQTTETTPWASLLTVYSGQRNLTSAGRPRVDLNGMDLVKLQLALTEALDANWAAFIVAYRQYGPSVSADAGTPGPPPTNAAMPPRYVISSVLDLAGARVAIPSPVPSQPPKVYASPMPADPQAMAQQLSNLLDKTTIVNAAGPARRRERQPCAARRVAQRAGHRRRVGRSHRRGPRRANLAR